METGKKNQELAKPQSNPEVIRLNQRNFLILAIINSIGCYLDKKFAKIDNFNFNDNQNYLRYVFDYFVSCCEKKNLKIEKTLATQLIYNILIHQDNLGKHYVDFLKFLAHVITSEDILKNEDNFLSIFIPTYLEKCLKKEQFAFFSTYKEKNRMSISFLFNVLICLYKDNSEKDLQRFVFEDLKRKYPKLIILDSFIESIDLKKEDFLDCLNKLINLEIKTAGDVKILEFINSDFHLREPSNEEFTSYFNEKPKDKKKRKSKRNSHDGTSGKSLPYSSNGKESINETNYSENCHEPLSPNFDNNDSFQKFICDELNKMKTENNMIQAKYDTMLERYDTMQERYDTMQERYDTILEKFDTIQEQYDTMQEKYDTIRDKLELTQDELRKEKRKRKEADEISKNANYELFKVKIDNSKMEKKIGDLQLDMKIIKVRTVYKAIIDIFAQVFGLNLSDSYREKKDKIINQLKLFGQNKNIKDLQDFLEDILLYIYKGNDLAHYIDKNIVPLDFVFSVLEENCKLNYSSLKPILQKLSFNETLKYAYGSYFSQDDYDKILDKIKFSKEDLQESLL